MVKKSVVEYLQSMLQKGYDISAIRNEMLKYGYTDKDIDDAINKIYNPTIRHEIHLSKTTIMVIVFVVLSLIGVGSFFYFISTPHAPNKLLDLNLEPVTTTVKPGESIIFVKELSNLGSSKRYDVVIKQEILDPKSGKIVTEKTETRAIETFGATQTKILVPKDTKSGNYVLRAIVEYDNKKAVATLPIKVVVETKDSCTDGIKNQNEEGIDCGGICNPCAKQNIDCNDNDPCTNDYEEDAACVNTQIKPCCGNNICEEQEKETCKDDCRKAEPSAELPTTPTLEETKELARYDPTKALYQCNQIEVPDLKDTCYSNIGEVQQNKNYCTQIKNIKIKDVCYSNIAKVTNDNALCEEISTEGRKDSCFMTFVLDNKDYSLCDKITNQYLRQSCESLRQLDELNKQRDAQTEVQE